MKTLVLGAGKVGFGIAAYLNNQQESVTIIEKSPEVVAKIKNISNLDVIVGDAMDIESLKEADAENAGYVIATMPHDEQNIIACKLAGSFFNVKTKIARIRSTAFLQGNAIELFLKENLGIDVIIHPEKEVADTICRIAEVDGAFDVVNTEHSIIVGLKCLPNTEVLSTTFSHFRGITDLDLFVLTITRNNKTFFPKGDDILIPGDEIYIATTEKHLDTVMQLFGYHRLKNQNILIIGGDRISAEIVQVLSANNSNLKISIIEESIEQAEKLAEEFPHLNVVCGDPLDHNFLENVSQEIDAAIISTGKEKSNVLAALFLKEKGIQRIFVLTKSNTYDNLLPLQSGCSSINSSAITIESILQKSRKGKIKSVNQLRNQSAEIVEAAVTESCTHIGKSVKSLKSKDQVIPIFLIRSGITMLAQNEVALCSGDVVLMLVTKSGKKSIDKIFSSYVYTKNNERNSVTTEKSETDGLN